MCSDIIKSLSSTGLTVNIRHIRMCCRNATEADITNANPVHNHTCIRKKIQKTNTTKKNEKIYT